MDAAVRQSLIGEISDIIGSQRPQVIADVRNAISNHIGSKSPGECLTLVKRNSSGAVTETLPMALDTRYASALIAFVRKKEFEGRPLDSALTDSTANVVADVFAARVGERADAISEKIMPILISDQRFIDGLSGAIVELSSATLPRHLQRQVIHLLTAKLSSAVSQSIDTATTATIKASVVKLTATSVASPIAAKIAFAVVKSLSVVLKPIIIKLMASTAFKAAIMAKLKAIIVGSILGAFIKLIGAKLGMSAGAVFMWILLPAVLAWLAYEVIHFPAKLADKVSTGVAEDLENNFPSTSYSMAETLVERIVVEGAGIVAAQLINDENIISMLRECVNEAA